MSVEEVPDTYLMPNADGEWEEVTAKDPRLKDVRTALREFLKTSLQITNKVALRNQFARKAYTPVGVSREFYQLTRKTFRGLYHNPARWQLLEYILFHAVPDERTGHLPITQTTLARIEGAKIRGGRARNYCVRFSK